MPIESGRAIFPAGSHPTSRNRAKPSRKFGVSWGNWEEIAVFRGIDGQHSNVLEGLNGAGLGLNCCVDMK